jgi:hypothetical protein
VAQSVNMMEPLGQQPADTSFTFKVNGADFREDHTYQSIFTCQEQQCQTGNPPVGAELSVDGIMGNDSTMSSHSTTSTSTILQERLCNMDNAHDPLYNTTADACCGSITLLVLTMSIGVLKLCGCACVTLRSRRKLSPMHRCPMAVCRCFID